MTETTSDLRKRIDAITALREHLEAMLRDPRAENYAPGKKLVIKWLNMLPSRNAPISDFDDDKLRKIFDEISVSVREFFPRGKA